MGRAWYLFLQFSVLACGPTVVAKKEGGELQIQGSASERWRYVGEFGFAIGRGTYTFRVKAQRPEEMSGDVIIAFEQYLDEDWPIVVTKEACKKKDLARKVKNITVWGNGTWSEIKGAFRQSVRSHIWYFAINDCNGSLPNYGHSLRYEFHALQEDLSEFSVEHRWSPVFTAVTIAGFSIFMASFYHECKAFGRSAGAIHPVIWALGLTVAIQYMAGWLSAVHLTVYSSNGSGSRAVHMLADILGMLSQVCQTSLMIVIGLGYTLLPSKADNLDVVLPICFLVALFHVVVLAFGKVLDDRTHRYHDHEGLVGWIVLVMRLGLYCWFMRACRITELEGGIRLRAFLKVFKFAGSLYFLAYPVLFLIVGLFAPYLRAPIMASGLVAMQVASNVWLSRLFLTRGEYFKVSTLNSSFLPGGGGTSPATSNSPTSWTGSPKSDYWSGKQH